MHGSNSRTTMASASRSAPSLPLSDTCLGMRRPISLARVRTRTTATTLHFDASNWQTPQEFVVTGRDDAAADGDVKYEVTVEAQGSALTTSRIGLPTSAARTPSSTRR